MIGKSLGHYEIIEKLGSGGMGDVYRARDTKLNRDVAIKVLPAEFAQDAERHRRFIREAKAIAALKHPNIVTIYSVEDIDDVHFITMEIVDGQPLSAAIPTGGLPVEQFFDIAIAVSDAISTAHESGIMHRDLKPANIMVERSGLVKVLDFGLAKLLDEPSEAGAARTEVASSDDTAVGQILGTAAYMSPEQAEGKPVDNRSDVFSLGIVLYEMATGERPFKGDTRISTISSILKDTPPTISDIKQTLPRHLGRIVNRCLEKNPDRRFQSAKDVRNDLAGLKREIDTGQYASGTSISSVGAGFSAPRRANLRRWVPFVLIVGVAVIAAVLYFGSRDGASNVPAPPPLPGQHATLSTRDATHRPMAVVFPFENLGPSEDAYFAAGIADEITSRLAAVEDIGVISHTSATQYDRTGKTMKQVAEDLGVDYVLEGTVRWAKSVTGDRVRITPRLIHAADDTQVWSETYDHEIDDIFDIQSTIAKKVIDQLGATLELSEQVLVADAPTHNVEAYKLYMQARGMTALNDMEDVKEREDLLKEAIRLDPTFVAAYAELSMQHSNIYTLFDRTESRLRKAREALNHAKALKPDHYMTRLAQGYYDYYGFRDYDAALAQFLAAAKDVPNDAEVRQAIGYIYRRQGKWQESIEALETAMTLDPRDANIPANLSATYRGMREFETAIRYLNRAIDLEPDNVNHYFSKAMAIVDWTGDIQAALGVMDSVDENARNDIFHLGMCFTHMNAHDYGRVVEEANRITGTSGVFRGARSFLIAGARSLADGPHEARDDIMAARAVTEELIENAPSNDLFRFWHAWELAMLGQNDAAVREQRLAVDMTAKDAFSGPANLEYLAQIYAWVGREEEALDILERLMNTVYESSVTPASLKTWPIWEPLYDNPRFQALLKKNT